MDTEEKDFLEDTDENTIKPKKKQLSEQKLQHLQNIRVKALEKKKEMKEITEKANKLKEIESLKKAKQYEKEQLAKQYDEMIEKEKKEKKVEEPKEEKPVEEKSKEEKPKEKIKDQPHSGDMPSGREIKPKKKKIIKKVIYQEASSSDSDGADEVEIVKVKKQPKQPKPEPEPKPQQKPVINNSYSNLLYESSIDKLKSRMMEDRAKYLVQSVMPSYG